MNDKERCMWINNDESLYNWWRKSRQSLREFIKTNRFYIDAAINAVLNRKPNR